MQVLLRITGEALGERPLIDTPQLLARWVEHSLNETAPDDVEYSVVAIDFPTCATVDCTNIVMLAVGSTYCADCNGLTEATDGEG